MIAHPAIVSRLNRFLGPGWAENPAHASVNRQGATGTCIHGGPHYGRIHGYHVRQGQPRTGSQVNFSWCLRDVGTREGGFCLIPASHKMRFPIPVPVTQSIELPAVKPIFVRAGDVIFYHGGATCHGVTTWRGEEERRVVLKTALPANFPLYHYGLEARL